MSPDSPVFPYEKSFIFKTWIADIGKCPFLFRSRLYSVFTYLPPSLILPFLRRSFYFLSSSSFPFAWRHRLRHCSTDWRRLDVLPRSFLELDLDPVFAPLRLEALLQPLRAPETKFDILKHSMRSLVEIHNTQWGYENKQSGILDGQQQAWACKYKFLDRELKYLMLRNVYSEDLNSLVQYLDGSK